MLKSHNYDDVNENPRICKKDFNVGGNLWYRGILQWHNYPLNKNLTNKNIKKHNKKQQQNELHQDIIYL